MSCELIKREWRIGQWRHSICWQRFQVIPLHVEAYLIKSEHYPRFDVRSAALHAGQIYSVLRVNYEISIRVLLAPLIFNVSMIHVCYSVNVGWSVMKQIAPSKNQDWTFQEQVWNNNVSETITWHSAPMFAVVSDKLERQRNCSL